MAAGARLASRSVTIKSSSKQQRFDLSAPGAQSRQKCGEIIRIRRKKRTVFLVTLLDRNRTIIQPVMLAIPVRLGNIAIVTDNSFLPPLGNSFYSHRVRRITSTATLASRNRLIADAPILSGAGRSEKGERTGGSSSLTGRHL
jgi:hypothetical protein